MAHEGDVMGKRVGLLTGLLILALGSGAVAQEPSPEPIPLYAPDDLTSALPAYLGDLRMDNLAYEGLEHLEELKLRYLDHHGGLGAWHEVLQPLGKDLSDVRFAAGGPISLDGSWAWMLVFRVEGVMGTTFLDGLLAAAAEGIGLADGVVLDDPAPTRRSGDQTSRSSLAASKGRRLRRPEHHGPSGEGFDHCAVQTLGASARAGRLAGGALTALR